MSNSAVIYLVDGQAVVFHLRPDSLGRLVCEERIPPEAEWVMRVECGTISAIESIVQSWIEGGGPKSFSNLPPLLRSGLG